MAIPLQENEEQKQEYRDRLWSSNAEVNATIKKYQKSNEGDYIEFILEISYIGGGRTWTLNKRYSDFVYVHNKILSSKETDIPKLPPKIDNRSPKLLESRKIQLETYLNLYLEKYPINPIILEFCEFANTGSPIFKELSHMYIKTIDCKVPDKYYKLTETNTADTFYQASIQIFPQNDQNPIQVKIQLTYQILKQFYLDLKLLASMGDIDISGLGEIPSKTTEKGQNKLDEEIMKDIEDYINRFQCNQSLLNLIVFKKLIADNVIDDSEFETEELRYSNKRAGFDVFGSITEEKDMFSGIEF